MIKVDIPRTIGRRRKSGEYVTRDYIIYKKNRNDDINGDMHLKDFIGYWSEGYKKKHNKRAMKYYKACSKNKVIIDYDWFMNGIEKYFKQFEDIETKRDIHDSWYGGKSEYILLTFKGE